MLRIDVITVFPGMFEAALGESMIKRAQEKGILQIVCHDLRDYTHDKHRSVDDRPYGGGPGMVMKPEPLFEAMEAIKRACRDHSGGCQTLLMSPRGETFSPLIAKELAAVQHLIIICGHYEGIDERIMALVHRSISIGDYVLTCGELPAMVTIDALARFVPGVIGHKEATKEESFADGHLEYPHYTRPETFRNMQVPQVLLSGDHEEVARWRKQQSVAVTASQRPDLLRKQVNGKV